MTVRTHTTMMAFSIATFCLTSSVVAGVYSQLDPPKKWLITPMAHTNQDDEEKRMNLPIPFDKEVSLTATGTYEKDVKSMTTLAYLFSSDPVAPPQDIGSIEGMSSVENDYLDSFDTVRKLGAQLPTSDSIADPSGSGGFTAPAVPAPGVLGLLALAGLTARRRRR